MPYHQLSPWFWLVFLGVWALLIVLRPLGSKSADGDDDLDDGGCSGDDGGGHCD